MDNETITARQIGHTYMLNSSTFAKRYKDTLSDYKTWEQKEHASDWILLPQNVGVDYSCFVCRCWVCAAVPRPRGLSGAPVIGLGLNEVIIYFGTDVLEIHYMLSKLFSTAIVFFWNFFARRCLLFSGKK